MDIRPGGGLRLLVVPKSGPPQTLLQNRHEQSLTPRLSASMRAMSDVILTPQTVAHIIVSNVAIVGCRPLLSSFLGSRSAFGRRSVIVDRRGEQGGLDIGEVTFASVLGEDGRQELFSGVEEALETGAEGRIELGYNYAPGLVPAEACPSPTRICWVRSERWRPVAG